MIFGNDGHSTTDSAIRSPRPGDHYTEMFSFSLFVVHVDGDTVATLECSCGEGVVMPRDGLLRTQTQEEFQKRLAYSSRAGYWVDLVTRGFNVKGWYEYAISQLSSLET